MLARQFHTATESASIWLNGAVVDRQLVTGGGALTAHDQAQEPPGLGC
jgi:hypothetical protein